jgi:hypothetical protein
MNLSPNFQQLKAKNKNHRRAFQVEPTKIRNLKIDSLSYASLITTLLLNRSSSNNIRLL